jgi:DNA-binding SARP family transcriptional activator
VSGEPLRESARLALIEAHLAESNVAAALREYEAFRQLLHVELGIEPSADLRALVDGLS